LGAGGIGVRPGRGILHDFVFAWTEFKRKRPAFSRQNPAPRLCLSTNDLVPNIERSQNVKEVTASQVAKWAAIATLVLAALYTALLQLEPVDDSPSVWLFVFIGVGVLALVAPVVCILACIVNRLQKKR